jgi:sugar phosphate isomerase/epimerase
MKTNGHDIAVCSWSLKPADMGDLVTKVKALGLEHIQLALGDLVMLDDKRKHHELGQLRTSGIKLTGGMMSFPGEDYGTIALIRKTGGFVPDDTWAIRRQLMTQAAALAEELGIDRIGVHVGFVPPSSDPHYNAILARVCEVAEPLSSRGIQLLMETGQEPASELLQFLNDLKCRNVEINFDPANMILYGAGDPIEAIHTLGRHIQHVHVKDATLSARPGEEWGEEVPFGTGQVPVRRFLDALKDAGYTGPLAIEREAGADRMADVRTAIETLRSA